MSTIKDGGPAFPLPLGTANCAEPSQSGGMSLRDYFAAKAMHALITGRTWDHHKGTDDELIGVWASSAYALADTMLRAREQS